MELPCLEDAIPKTIDGLSNVPAMYLYTFSHLFVGSEFADEVCEDGHIVGYVHEILEENHSMAGSKSSKVGLLDVEVTADEGDIILQAFTAVLVAGVFLP